MAASSRIRRELLVCRNSFGPRRTLPHAKSKQHIHVLQLAALSLNLNLRLWKREKDPGIIQLLICREPKMGTSMIVTLICSQFEKT